MNDNKALTTKTFKTSTAAKSSRVDSHQHFWQLSRGDYTWLTPELTVLYKDFLPEALAPELAANNVSETILVQAADNEAETDFLLELAKNTYFVVGVVGWIDLQNNTAINRLIHFAKNPYFKGIRPMLQDIDDVNWILKEQFTAIFTFMEENSLTFDALVNESHLANIYILAKRHPKLFIVIDHCAKPDLSNATSQGWKSGIAQIAQCKNVFIKLSGLLTQAPQGEVTIERIQPYFDHIISVFSTNRVMWGSDWPVVKLNGDYDTWISHSTDLLANYPSAEQDNIWANNARHFYRLVSQQ